MQNVADGRANRSLILVAGSGRSGTSLFTGLAGRLGAYIPQPEVTANKSNPRGFGEPRWAVDFHDELLRSVAVIREDSRPEAWELAAKVAERKRAPRRLRTWLTQQFEGSDTVIIKDPRLAWFLDLYAKVAADLSADLSVVTMLRHPAASIKSRELAYGEGAGNITRMTGWLNMMLFVEHRTRQLPRAVVRYDDLLTQWRSTMSAVDARLPVSLLGDASEEQLAEAEALVDPTLRRAEATFDELGLPERLRSIGELAYEQLKQVAAPPDSTGDVPGTEETLSRLDAVRAEYVAYYEDSVASARSSIIATRTKERRVAERRLSQQQERHEAELRALTLTPRNVGRRLRRRLSRSAASDE